MSKAEQVSILLAQLSQELKILGLWQNQHPPASALASTQPFCIDTLEFHQWLQFIFIEKMQLLIEHKQTLPNNLALMPLAEEIYKQTEFDTQGLFSVLTQIDRLFE